MYVCTQSKQFLLEHPDVFRAAGGHGDTQETRNHLVHSLTGVLARLGPSDTGRQTTSLDIRTGSLVSNVHNANRKHLLRTLNIVHPLPVCVAQKSECTPLRRPAMAWELRSPPSEIITSQRHSRSCRVRCWPCHGTNFSHLYRALTHENVRPFHERQSNPTTSSSSIVVFF